MESASPKSRHLVAIADHLWELFEEIARSMGSDRDALINQAMFMFARANGFFDPYPGSASFDPKTNPAGYDPQFGTTPEFEGSSLTPDELPSIPPVPLMDAVSLPQTGDAFDLLPQVAERVENGAAAHPEGQAGLFIVSEDGHEGEVNTDRFLIGRGKHCDYVISSGKVSREHAVILREGLDYFIEDLGSSNGTWFNKQRIKRRKISDGDEYFVCSDKIKLVLR
jgi:hypothetical protein